MVHLPVHSQPGSPMAAHWVLCSATFLLLGKKAMVLPTRPQNSRMWPAGTKLISQEIQS